MIRYFPFCPGIPWQTSRNKVYPRLSLNYWQQAIANRNPTVLSGDGLLQSYFSLAALEQLNTYFPLKDLYWSGSEKFEVLAKLNGLAKTKPNLKLTDKFPTPIFFDKKDGVYISSNFKVEKIPAYLGQVVNNSILEWTPDYLPKFRTWKNVDSELQTWMKINRIDPKSSFVCIFPERNFTTFEKSHLRWDEARIRSLAGMLRPHGVSLIVLTNSSQRYQGSQVYCLPNRIDYGLYLIRYARAVLSESMDWMLLGGILSNALLVSRIQRGYGGLARNLKEFDCPNDIYEQDTLHPLDVYQAIMNKVSGTYDSI